MLQWKESHRKLVTLGSVFDVITEVVGHLDQFILHCWLIVWNKSDGFYRYGSWFADRFSWERNEVNANTKFGGNHTAPMSSFKALASRLKTKFPSCCTFVGTRMMESFRTFVSVVETIESSLMIIWCQPTITYLSETLSFWGVLLTLLDYFSFLIYLKFNKEFKSCQQHHKCCFNVLNSN